MNDLTYHARGSILCPEPSLTPHAPYKFLIGQRVMWMEASDAPGDCRLRIPRRGVINRRGTYGGDRTGYVLWPDHRPDEEVLMMERAFYAHTDEGWAHWNPDWQPAKNGEAIRRGVWFQAKDTGWWYRNHLACGEVVGVNIDNETFRHVMERPQGTCRDCKHWSDVMPKAEGREHFPDEHACLKSRNIAFGAYGQDGKAILTAPCFGCNEFDPKATVGVKPEFPANVSMEDAAKRDLIKPEEGVEPPPYLTTARTA